MRILAPHLVILTLFAGCVAYWQMPPPIRTSREEHAKLKAGMTQREAEAILGGPPEDHTSDGVKDPFFFVSGEVLPECYLWATDEGCIKAYFYSNRFAGAEFTEVHRQPWVLRHVATLMLVLFLIISVAITQTLRGPSPSRRRKISAWRES